MWRLFWKVNLIKESEDHSDEFIYLLIFIHRFKNKEFIHKMNSFMLMEYDWNRKEYENDIYEYKIKKL